MTLFLTLMALIMALIIWQTDLAKELSLSRRTVQRIMKELMNDGKIKRVGSTRIGHWEIND